YRPLHDLSIKQKISEYYVSLSVDPRAIAHLAEEEGRPGSDDFSRLLRQQERETLSMAEALSAIDHERIAGLVILGGPGTGKTTVLRYLALTYARGLQGDRLDQSQPLLPLFIPLQAVTSDHAPSLADYMTQLCERQGCVVEPGFFDAQLSAQRCLVLLDGLDEVADERQRRAVSRWIAEQSRAYGRNPFVITCRPAGFREDFLPAGFLRLEVQNFGEAQVEAFAQNWCLAVETMLRGDTAEARHKADSDSADLIRAIQANKRVQDLAVNPLLLSIIALVHRYRARLPDRRVDLYAECVEVLLGHWDEAKAMQVPIPPGRALQVLQPLALWMHERKSGETERLARFGEIEPVIAPYLAGIGMRRPRPRERF
ncbi:NACHT domain-containing protein, partial [Candidatus Entotheonella palauensis]|uniref:NACHT domain-containing protein n=1 Tax=Candidatus Entotheonella palauensis TaxID=93172 RepID=UPI001C4E0AB0